MDISTLYPPINFMMADTVNNRLKEKVNSLPKFEFRDQAKSLPSTKENSLEEAPASSISKSSIVYVKNNSHEEHNEFVCSDPTSSKLGEHPHLTDSSTLHDNPSNELSEQDKLLQRRMQPIHELVYSEESFLKRLKIIQEKYIPIIDDGQIEVPDDLTNKWRILWGNWNQLVEWHTSFYEKLENLVISNPDKIPKLFIDSRARLRNLYSKYCENHRKAALIAEQYRDFFEEVRLRVGDKEDVVSHLMQPVQRIMRYQLPVGEIVKYTERANLPSIPDWKKALAIMKEIPGDTQLILEAARIDGFPGVITSLGRIRIRGDLQVAVTGRETRRNSSCAVDLKFMERRVFLFDQMLLITEEVKPKKKDVFSQSTYQFKHAINVNKMRFESRSGYEKEDDEESFLRFLLTDTSPGKESIYVVDPLNSENREQWVIQFKELQSMQQEFLLALQDPKRFATGRSAECINSKSSSQANKLSQDIKHKSQHLSTERCHSDNTPEIPVKKKSQKWPSFISRKQRSRTEDPSASISSQDNKVNTSNSSKSTSMERLCVVDRSPGNNNPRKSSTSDIDYRSKDSADSSSLNKEPAKLSTAPSSSNQAQLEQDEASSGSSTSVHVSISCMSSGRKKSSIFSSLFGSGGKGKHKNQSPATVEGQPTSTQNPQ